MNDSERDSLSKKIEGEIQQAVENAESFSRPDTLDIFDYTYANPTSDLKEQRESLAEFMAFADLFTKGKD
jgi:TPP-dependent pyruvate/acetoin dehydrogenase alpha subunit